MKKTERQAIFAAADQIGNLLGELEDQFGLSFDELDTAMELCRELHCEAETSVPETLHRRYRKHLQSGPTPVPRAAGPAAA